MDKTVTERSKVSADEMDYRMEQQDKIHNIPVQKAVSILDEFLDEVVGKLGVDTTKDRESIEFQMQVMGIHVFSIDRDEAPVAAGIYVTDGRCNPFAYIKEMEVNSRGKYAFKPAYWNQRKRKGKGDFNRSVRVKIG